MSDDTGPNLTLQNRLIREAFQYGAIGILLFVIVWQIVRLVNVFTPIGVEYMRVIDRTAIQNTAALGQIAATMVQMRQESKTNSEALAGVVSAICTRKR